MNEPLNLGDTAGAGKKEGESVSPNTSSSSSNTAKPINKKEDKVSEVFLKVDMTKKPESINEPVNLLNDDEFFDKQTEKTEGDVRQATEDKAKADALKAKLSSSSNTPLSSSTTPKHISPDKRQQQADKWVKAINIARIWGLKLWSGQADNTGLVVPDSDLTTLAESLADVMEEYDFDPAPLLTLAVTSVAVFGNSFSNAYDARKKIRTFKKENPDKAKQADESKFKTKPELDPATGKHNKRRGGQIKA